MQNAEDSVFVNGRKHPFVGHSYWSRLVTIEQNRAHRCLVDPVFSAQRYLTPRPKTGLQAREFATGKIISALHHVGALAVCDTHRAEVLEFVSLFQGLATTGPDIHNWIQRKESVEILICSCYRESMENTVEIRYITGRPKLIHFISNLIGISTSRRKKQ